MIKGGIGGSHTTTGLKFEGKVDFLKYVSSVKDYSVIDNKILYKKEEIAISLGKWDLYKFLVSQGIDYKKVISKRLLPDELIFSIKKNTFFIIEIKFQHVDGSTDEKLQTCHFKISQYQKLLKSFNAEIRFMYLLNDWFKSDKYQDVLNYIQSIPGCSYHFNQIPLEEFGFPS